MLDWVRGHFTSHRLRSSPSEYLVVLGYAAGREAIGVRDGREQLAQRAANEDILFHHDALSGLPLQGSNRIDVDLLSAEAGHA